MNKINILSLFDGLGGARIALDRLGIECNYYSSEIDKYAIKIAMKNYPGMIQLGDIKNIKGNNLPKIDLLIGGSPCQDLSISKKNREGLKGERSNLFYEYVRLLKEIKPKFFILENVNSMSKENKQVITDILSVNFIMINSILLTAQNRKRLYWVGELVNDNYRKVEIEQPENKNIYLKDILESGCNDRLKSYYIDANYFKGTNLKHYLKKKVRPLVFDKPVRIGKIGKGGQGDRIYSIEGKSVSLSANGGGRGAKTGLYCVAQRGRYNSDGSTFQKLEPRYDRKTNTLTSVQKDNYILEIKATDYIIRKLTPQECERLQTLDDNYTEGVSNSQRYKMIGNGFTIDVIKHILKHINWR